MKTKKILSTMTAAGLVVSSNMATAAVNGTLGAPNGESFGTKQISVTIPKRIKITGFEDFIFGDWDIEGDADIDNTDHLCVYSNSAEGYKVKASSLNGLFGLDADDATVVDHIIPYKLFWINDGVSTANGDELVYNTDSAVYNNHNRISASCAGSDNSGLRLLITANDLKAAPGTDTAYIDVVTITVVPN